MAHYDTIIKGGTVVDGLRSGRFVADIGIEDGKIKAIGGLDATDGDQVLDAAGLIVAPGFVDLHTHYDSQLFWDPYCSISSWHGVTSVAIGNCGFGFAPCRPEDRDRYMLAMSRNEAVPLKCMQEGMPWDWETFPEFLDSVDRTPKGVNVLSYVPLSPLMFYIMGEEAAKSRRPTADEIEKMCGLLEEAMDAGGCGFSAQVLGPTSVQRDYDGTPMVTDLLLEEEILAFAATLRKLGRGFVQCIGDNKDMWLRVAEVSGRPVLYNVVTIFADQHGVKGPGDWRDNLNWIHSANLAGKRIYGQALTTEQDFQFTMEDWNLFDSSPAWRDVTLGSLEERLAKFKDPARRAAVKVEFDSGDKSMVFLGAEGFRGITVDWVHEFELKGGDYEGRSIGEIADREGKHPIDAFFDLVIADGLRTGFGAEMIGKDLRNSPDYVADLATVASDPYCLPGISDGGAHTKFLTDAVYPTDYLIHLVKNHQAVSLEEAHWHLSALPAMAAGFRDRGVLQEGMPADIVIYDLDNLSLLPNERAYDYPAGEWRLVRKAIGYRWIMVNGQITFIDGDPTGATPGHLLRHGSAKGAPALT